MIDRVNAAISGAATRSAIFLRASERPSPMRISPRASSNSSISGPSMCSVSLETAPSKPMPASTLTASRSSASGRSAETCDWRRRPFVETKKLGAMNPPTPNTSTARKPVEDGDELMITSPKRTPPTARAACAARKPAGDVLRIPAAISLAVTPSSDAFGLTRSIRREARPTNGATTRSRNLGSSRPWLTRIRPYSVARVTRFRRSRTGAVTNSERKYRALQRQATATSSKSMASTFEGDDLFQEERAHRHHREHQDDEDVPGVRVEQRAHVARVEEGDREGEEEGDAAEHVGRHPAHRGQPADLPSEPPTWRWIVTAVIANSKFFEPARSAIASSASSIGRPNEVSVRTRLNSELAGGWPSSTTALRPCLNEWPAFSEAAIVISTSGS